MASVTFQTELGTSITGNGFRSSSSFEILKAAVSLIEQIELAEEAGTAGELLDGVVSAEVGGASGLMMITNKPENILFADDQLQVGEPIQVGEGALDEDCGDPDCPVHGYVTGAAGGDLPDESVIESLVGVIASFIEEASGENLGMAAGLQNETEDAYDGLEELLEEYYEEINSDCADPESPLVVIDELGVRIRDYADHLGDGVLAKAAIFSFGAGIELASNFLAAAIEEEVAS